MIDVEAANASLDALEDAEAVIARQCARRAVELIALIGHVGIEGAEGDIAGALKLTRWGAGQRAENALKLTSLPRLLDLMHQGLIDEYRVLAVHDEMTKSLQPVDDAADPEAFDEREERWAMLDRAVAVVAPAMDSAQLRRHVQNS